MDAAALGAKTACGVMVLEGLIAPVPKGLSGVACAQLCDPDPPDVFKPAENEPEVMFPEDMPDTLPIVTEEFTLVRFVMVLLLGMFEIVAKEEDGTIPVMLLPDMFTPDMVPMVVTEDVTLLGLLAKWLLPGIFGILANEEGWIFPFMLPEEIPLIMVFELVLEAKPGTFIPMLKPDWLLLIPPFRWETLLCCCGGAE